MPDRERAEAVLTVPADLARLAEIRGFVRESATAAGAGAEEVADLVQAVDECATNAIEHGYDGTAGSLEVAVSRTEDGLAVCVRDSARTFDPTTVPTPDTSTPLEQRRPGGMGVHLMRELTDEFVHRPLSPQGNEVTMVKRLGRDSEGRDRGDAR